MLLPYFISVFYFRILGFVEASPTISNNGSVLYVCSSYFLNAMRTSDGTNIYDPFKAGDYLGSAVTLGLDGSIYVGK